MTIKCNSCGGVYEPNQRGGRYFHACPPDVITQHATFNAATDAPILPEIRVPRPDARDENLVPQPDGKTKIRAEGKGTEELPVQAP